jgi:toxin ParE1/3/4
MLDKPMEGAGSLERFPERGSFPKALAVVGMQEYRQALFKLSRVIYRAIGRQVII